MADPVPEEKKEEEKKPEPSALDIFSQSFEEAANRDPAKEEPLNNDVLPPDEEAKPPVEPPPTDEEPPKEAAKEPEAEPPKEPPKEEPPKEQARVEPPTEPPKAPEPEPREEPVEQRREPEPVDYSLFFKGLENDINDAEIRKQYVDFTSDSEDLGNFVQTTSQLVGMRLINYVNESFKVLVEKITPYLEATRKSIEQQHSSSISEKHPDYRAIKEDVLGWIKEQPKYMQKSLMSVYDNGEPEDVVDMLNRYKKDRGLLAKQEEPAHEPEKPKDEETEKKELEKQKAQEKIDAKVENLAAVKTKNRPISPQGARSMPAEDFDDAFEEAVTSKRR